MKPGFTVQAVRRNYEDAIRAIVHHLLDEIERLIPSYKLDRLNLFTGNDVATQPGFVPVSNIAPVSARDLILPAHDGLFTSGVLGAHTAALVELNTYQQEPATEVAAD